jgi:hypothetical protein
MQKSRKYWASGGVWRKMKDNIELKSAMIGLQGAVANLEEKRIRKAMVEGYGLGKLHCAMVELINGQTREVCNWMNSQASSYCDLKVFRGICESSLGLARMYYSSARIIEEKYGDDEGEAKNAFYKFTFAHKQLCEYLASQKPWGERQ